MSSLNIKNGKIYLDDQARLCISADYPYYRDKRDSWKENLRSIKELGIDMVSCYVPWRHHLIRKNDTNQFTFNSRIKQNADLLGFLEIAKSLGLKVFLKPGPFIHGEVKAGGIPEHLLPANNPSVNPMKNYRGEPVSYMGDALPAPFNSEFLSESKRWFLTLIKVLKEHHALFPSGPVMGFQIGNEGIYSDANHSLLSFDFSREARNLFYDFLEKKYGEKKGRDKECRDFFDSLASEGFTNNQEKSNQLLLDWGEFQIRYLNLFHENFARLVPSEVMVLCNTNPPSLPENFNGTEGKELDHWLARNAPEKLSWVNYGFSNWSGNALHREDSFNRLVFMSKIGKGPNLEDNWGHEWAGEDYKEAFAPLYHGTLMLASGATGFNVYNAVRTESWPSDLEFHPSAIGNDFLRALVGKPNCASAPVQGGGVKSSKYEELAFFLTYLNQERSGLGRSELRAEIAVGYRQSDHINRAMDPQEKGEGKFWRLFSQLVKNNYPFKIVNLDHTHPNDLQVYDWVLIPQDMEEQEIQSFVQQLRVDPGANCFGLGGFGFSSTYFDSTTNNTFHFFFNRESKPGEFFLEKESIRIALGPQAFGILKTSDLGLESIYVKAGNPALEQNWGQEIQTKDHLFRTNQSCDLMVFREKDDWRYQSLGKEKDQTKDPSSDIPLEIQSKSQNLRREVCQK